MAEQRKNEAVPDGYLTRWLDRVGAALVAPKLALACSDTPAARGRASSDVLLLLLLALLVRETHLVVTAGWLVLDGQWADAFIVLAGGAQKYLLMAIMLLLGGTAALSLLAGRRRSVADDFDLVCVSLMPLVVIELANALVQDLGLNLHPLTLIVGYGWSAGVWILSLMQTRSREQAS